MLIFLSITKSIPVNLILLQKLNISRKDKICNTNIYFKIRFRITFNLSSLDY